MCFSVTISGVQSSRGLSRRLAGAELLSISVAITS
jgi:hypothetical protein